MADPVQKWYVVGVFKDRSRTDPDALSLWAPIANVFAQGIPVYDTPEEAAAAAAAWPVNQWDTMLSYIPERISNPTVYAGPRNVYLPAVSPSYAEYPYTVQGYSFSFTAYRTGGETPLNYTTLIVASGLTDADAIPPPPDPEDPPDVTVQLKRDNTVGQYSIKPSDSSVLPKYGGGVAFIRAKFDNGTRVAVIEETLDGGFVIYEEIASVAVTPVYVYSGERRLIEIIDAAYLPAYRAQPYPPPL